MKLVADQDSVSPRQAGGALIAGSNGLAIELLTSQEAFDSLETEWNALVSSSASPNVFMTWEWVRTWWECFGQGLDPLILVARESEGGPLVGIAPFVRRTYPVAGGPFRELSWLGGMKASGDHLDVVARAGREDAVAACFADCLGERRRRWDVLALDWGDAGSPLAALLRRENTRPVMAWEHECPFLPLPDRWEDYLATLGKNLRRDLKYLAGRLNRDTGGKVERRRVASAEELPAAMDDLFRLHQEVRTAHGQRGAFHDPAVRGFHCRVAERFLERGWLRLHLLKAGGQTIAAIYCFRYGNKVSFYQTGYDSAWARYSPGAAVVAQAIRESIEEGAREFDFLRGDEAYKWRWNAATRRNVRLRLATTARGGFLVLAYRTAYAARTRFREWRARRADKAAPAQAVASSMTSGDSN